MSAQQFSQADFATQVLSTIDEHSINPRRLKLELTESILANNIDDIIITMKQLQAAGVQFS
ncbi:MAG: EAL domain-containing protein [Cycloclasticus sp.]|nr:EAL domain-containing protein [Cycloclasticus sp.]